MTDISKMTEKDLCFMFDHTNLKAYASSEDIRKLCAEAKEYGFRMVAINPVHTAMCREILSGTDVHVGPCVSFPLGQNTIEEKCTETLLAISQGADEIDYVTNLTAVKDGRWDYIEREMRTIADICRSAGVISKVIFENCYLEKQEIEQRDRRGRSAHEADRRRCCAGKSGRRHPKLGDLQGYDRGRRSEDRMLGRNSDPEGIQGSCEVNNRANMD